MTDLLPLGGGTIAGPQIVLTRQDVLDLLPTEFKQAASAPIRDALADALLALNLTYQDRAALAAGLNDILSSTGDYLRSLGEDRGIYQQPNEDQEAYRQRLLAVPDLVTPTAVIAVVNAILAPLTSVQAQYLESVSDRMYLRASDQLAPAAILNGSPWYQDRLYPEDAVVNGGAFRPNASPGGAWLFSDWVGRYFVLRVPDLSGIDRTIDVLYAPSDPGDPDAAEALLTRELYTLTLGDSTDPGAGNTYPGTAFTYQELLTSLAAYFAIVSAVEIIRGHSIRWQLFIDPTLV